VIRALQSFAGLVLDAAVGRMVHAGSAAPPPAVLLWSEPDPGPAVRETAWGAPREEPHRDDDLGTGDVKLVEHTIVCIRTGHERILAGGSGEEMVRGPMTRDGLVAWIVAGYPRWHEVPPEDKRYLRVYYRVLDRWPARRPGRGREDAALEGIRDAIRGWQGRPPSPSPEPVSRPPASSVVWDGTGTPTQVGARGRVTLTKARNGDGYDILLEGTLAIHSRSYGYVRHGLPPGYLPVSADPRAYPCEVQRHATLGDLSGVDNYGGRGVHVRNDSFPGYEGRATLWFPERDYNGEIALRCAWRTKEPLP